MRTRAVNGSPLIKPLYISRLLVGSSLAVYGIYTAIIDGNTFWYTYFTIGTFVLFDSLDQQLNGDSNLLRLFKGQPEVFFGTYFLFFIMGILIDTVLGQAIGNMWIYPSLEGGRKFFHILIVGYPFALLSVSSMYRTIDGLTIRVLNQQTNHTRAARDDVFKIRVAQLLTISFIVALTVPILNWLLLDNRYSHELLVICCALGLFSISPITYFVFRASWFNQLFGTRKRAVTVLLLTWLCAAFLHEFPNTFAWQWVYQNIPFTSWKILGVSIIVIAPGWIFLTILAVAGNDFFFQWANSKLRHSIPSIASNSREGNSSGPP